ncbi:MAG TPA: methylated-DNA--[protein]-cysteine S-methyltransferase [Syntrophales bacterium]|nr:methylated-DNA--[protein]-cysteine S-methyltransferase [Syntrophales bacterium]
MGDRDCRGKNRGDDRGLSYRVLVTPIGEVAVVWGRDGEEVRLRRVVLPGQGGASPTAGSLVPAAGADDGGLEDLMEGIEAFLRGIPVSFPFPEEGLGGWSSFSLRVLKAVWSIPRGRVASYGGVARAAGRDGAARAVGRVMAANPFPIVIPCHRVVRGDGNLGGFGGGRAMKEYLLRLEGVRISHGRITNSCLWNGAGVLSAERDRR